MRSFSLSLFFIVFIPFVFLPPLSHAAGFSFGLEPLVGYERVQKIVPTQHTSDRLMYGGRAIFGVPLVSGELEYTRGMDTETFTSPSLTTKDTDDKVKAGLRSSIRLGSLFYLLARAGGQAKQ